jgi:TonB dependent receptor
MPSAIAIIPGKSTKRSRTPAQATAWPSAPGFVIGADGEQNANRQALGALSFQPVFTAQLAYGAQGLSMPVANTGDAFADFLLGFPLSGTLAGLPIAEYRGTQMTPFAQDTWKVTPNLTLNYGVSWFVETPPDPRGWARGAVHGFDPSDGLFTFAALGQISPEVISTRWNNVAPRFGAAWRPESLGSTVFRVGAGIYYSQMPWLMVLFPLAYGSPLGGGMNFTNPQSIRRVFVYRVRSPHSRCRALRTNG